MDSMSNIAVDAMIKVVILAFTYQAIRILC